MLFLHHIEFLSNHHFHLQIQILFLMLL